MTLSLRDRAVLEFERSWWTEPGTKDSAVARRFEVTMSEYQQVLCRLIDDEDALAADQLVVRRLRRQRDRRRQARAEQRSAGGGQI